MKMLYKFFKRCVGFSLLVYHTRGFIGSLRPARAGTRRLHEGHKEEERKSKLNIVLSDFARWKVTMRPSKTVDL